MDDLIEQAGNERIGCPTWDKELIPIHYSLDGLSLEQLKSVTPYLNHEYEWFIQQGKKKERKHT